MGRKDSLEFLTWSDMIERAENHPVEEQYKECARTSRDSSNYRNDFTLTRNYEEAVTLARAGWPEGTKKALAMCHKIEDKLHNLVNLPTIQYDVTGEILDVGRYCGGEPEHWGTFYDNIREGKSTKYVHIVLSGFVSCGISTDSMIARGSAVAALVNVLELSGARVRISVTHALVGTDTYQIITRLKQYDEVLDLDRVTFALAHPAMYRRHIFSVMETLPDNWPTKVGAYSYYSHPGAPVTEQGDIYLPEMSAHDDQWETPESSTQWVLEELKRQGVIKPE